MSHKSDPVSQQSSRIWEEFEEEEEEPTGRLARRGELDAVMWRQLKSRDPYLRLIGEIRYLLAPHLLDQEEDRFLELSERLPLLNQDPAFRDKVGAQYVIDQEHKDLLQDSQKARWHEELLSEIDPDNPAWLQMRALTQNGEQPWPEEQELPGSPFTCNLFLQFCREFDRHADDIDRLVDQLDQEYLQRTRHQTRNSTRPDLSDQDARARHLRRLQEDPEYRVWVEKTLQMLLNLVKGSPMMLQLFRETLFTDQRLGFPGEEQFRANLAGLREDIEALFQAVESGELRAPSDSDLQ